MPELPKVYAWCNGGMGTDWQVWMAMAEDGEVVCSHVSSTRSWGIHDAGPAMHGEQYEAKFGGTVDGEHFDYVVCDEGKGPPDEVYARNQRLRAEHEAKQAAEVPS